ncbi:MAG: hypothetical protein IKK47_08950 [Ruminococcus sp.]|nr:hypothetical protein [Ruminococcus sp.]
MKKKIFLVSMAAAFSTMIIPCSGAAENNTGYQPSLYFKPIETDEAQVLKNGTVYVNSSLLTGKNNSFNAEVYIDDDQKQAGHIIAKWKCESEHIALGNLTDPITLYGKSPYEDFSTPSSIPLTEYPELNRQYVSYPNLTELIFVLTGENSDDYPLAGFSATVDSKTPAERYEVEFMSGESGAQCEILYKYGKNNPSFKEFFPTGEYAKPMNINISDRMLGDIDNNGIITGSDATMILAAYTNISSSGDSKLTKEQEIAADIDADGIITGSDATLLLRYYTALSSGEKLSVYDYFLEN